MTRRYLHGFLGAPAQWTEVLALTGDALADCPRLPGHGRPPWTPPGDFSAVVDAFAARALPPEPVTLVGYSLGARVALALALRHPARVSRLVLIGVAYGIDGARDRDTRTRADDALADALDRDGVASFVRAWEGLPLFATQRALPAPLAEAQRAWRLDHTAPGLSWSLRTLGLGRQPALRAAFARSTVPVTLVTGAEDEKFTAIARELVALRAGVDHRVVEGSGHNVALERPDAVAAAIAGEATR
jgi:2-succinyl-6-hydroxy-2,4-cyclohexadiene-1-carboxylate synthase